MRQGGSAWLSAPTTALGAAVAGGRSSCLRSSYRGRLPALHSSTVRSLSHCPPAPVLPAATSMTTCCATAASRWTRCWTATRPPASCSCAASSAPRPAQCRVRTHGHHLAALAACAWDRCCCCCCCCCGCCAARQTQLRSYGPSRPWLPVAGCLHSPCPNGMQLSPCSLLHPPPLPAAIKTGFQARTVSRKSQQTG